MENEKIETMLSNYCEKLPKNISEVIVRLKGAKATIQQKGQRSYGRWRHIHRVGVVVKDKNNKVIYIGKAKYWIYKDFICHNTSGISKSRRYVFSDYIKDVKDVVEKLNGFLEEK